MSSKNAAIEARVTARAPGPGRRVAGVVLVVTVMADLSEAEGLWEPPRGLSTATVVPAAGGVAGAGVRDVSRRRRCADARSRRGGRRRGRRRARTGGGRRPGR